MEGEGDLLAADLEALVSELLVCYKEPGFQKGLERLRTISARAAAAGACADIRGSLRPLVLDVQAPVLEKYGLPATAEGVGLMTQMVQRRIAEGATRLEALANDARRALGLRPLPDRTEVAEHVLAECASETERRVCAEIPGAFTSPERQCQLRISQDRASGALPPASAELLEELLDQGRLEVPALLALLNMAKVGIPASRLVNSGIAADWSVPELQACTAEELFSSYVLPNEPVIIRSASAFHQLLNLADLEYLQSRCGHRRVLVKSLSHKDRAGRAVFVTDPNLKLPFSAFLEAISEKSQPGKEAPFYLGKVPLQQELPELAEDLKATLSCPQRAFGSCFGTLVPQGVFTYFGSGRNTTPTHFDGYDNLMLCLCGGKHLLLYPPSNAEFMSPVGDGILHPPSDFSRAALPPFSTPETLPPELRGRFTKLSQAQPLEVWLGAGDLLYLPCCWWHCVEGTAGRNMILNWWFNLHPDKLAMARGSTPCPTSCKSIH